jgi:hypothetical protein
MPKNEVEFLTYRIDMLEKKLETIEKLLLSHNKTDINSELLKLLLNMVKGQAVTEAAAPATPASKPSSQSPRSQSPERGDLFGFSRRRTIV